MPPSTPPTPSRFWNPTAIEWRGIRLEPHGPWIWLSADRLWKLTTAAGEEHWVAYLQLDPELFFVDHGATAEAALDALATRTTAIAEQLTGALRQARR